MKKLLLIIIFSVISTFCFATDWLTYYVYVQTTYLDGPWTRSDLLYKSDYQYLFPVKKEGLFGTVQEDIANAIMSDLKTASPKRYTFNYTLTLVSDTVILTTNDSIKEAAVVKNELIASFILNHFAAVKLIQKGVVQIFQLKDLTVPLMDLVFPGDVAETGKPAVANPAVDTFTDTAQNERPTNNQSNKNKIQ